MREPHRPLKVSSYVTHDMAEAYEYIRRTYVENTPNLSENTKGFRYECHSADAGLFRTDIAEFNVGGGGQFCPYDDLLCLSIASGSMNMKAGRDEVRLGPGDVALYPQSAYTRVTWPKVRTGLFTLSLGLVRRKAAEVSGIAEEDFRIQSVRPTSPAAERSWTRFLSYLYRETRNANTALKQDLVRAEAANMAAALLLHTFPSTATTARPASRPDHVAPAAVRRAMAYMDEHAHEPVTMKDVAAAAGISARALQKNFTRYYDSTPTAHLRRVRLERAHRDLQAADPTAGATVAAIAARWGFTKPSQFTAYYRQHYGTLPSHTLRT